MKKLKWKWQDVHAKVLRQHPVAIQASVRVPEDGDQEKIRNPRKEDVRLKKGN